MTTPFIPDVTKWTYRQVQGQSRKMPLFRSGRATGNWELDAPGPLNHHARFVAVRIDHHSGFTFHDHCIIVYNDAKKFDQSLDGTMYVVYVWRYHAWMPEEAYTLSGWPFHMLQGTDVIRLIRDAMPKWRYPRIMSYEQYQREVTE